MRKVLYIIFIFLFLPCISKAEEHLNYRWQANLYGGIYIENEQAWIIEPSVSLHFNKYLGVAMGIEFTSQYNQPSHSISINGKEAYTDDNTKNIGWMIFKPSLVIMSPIVWKNKDDDYRLWFQLEPGISLACPFRNSATYKISTFSEEYGSVSDYVSYPNKSLKWFYWNAQISANFSVDRIVVGLGYSFSNFDYYSCRRTIELPNGANYYVPKKEFSQSIFLSVGYKF